MKILFFLLTMIIIISSCNLKPKSFNEQMTEMRENFAKNAKEFNANALLTDKLIDSIYQLSDTNHGAALSYIDNAIQADRPRIILTKPELHFLKGDIYYRIDSLTKSIAEFKMSAGQTIDSSPKILAALAGCFIKLKDYPAALADLKQATNLDSTYYWNIGNYYEIINRRDSAILNYEHLYFKNVAVFQYCRNRIDTLRKENTQLLKELVFYDRLRMHITLLPIN